MLHKIVFVLMLVHLSVSLFLCLSCDVFFIFFVFALSCLSLSCLVLSQLTGLCFILLFIIVCGSRNQVWSMRVFLLQNLSQRSRSFHPFFLCDTCVLSMPFSDPDMCLFLCDLTQASGMAQTIANNAPLGLRGHHHVQGCIRQNNTQRKSRQNNTRQDTTRQDNTRQENTRQHQTRQHQTVLDNPRQHNTT